MSDYVREKAKIKIIAKGSEKVLEEMRNILNNNGVSEDKYLTYGTKEYFRDMYYDDYVIGDSFLGKYEDHEEIRDSYDFCEFNKIDDDTYYCHALFYNGGTCFSEIVENQIKKDMKND